MERTDAAHRLVNNTGKQVKIYVEPWGGEYLLDVGEHVDIFVEDAAVHPVEWEIGSGTLTISSLALSNASISLWRDGAELKPS